MLSSLISLPLSLFPYLSSLISLPLSLSAPATGVIRRRLGLPVERDRPFIASKPLSTFADEARVKSRIADLAQRNQTHNR
ncbi:DUF2958 domain-containing protein [Bradyrhizobium japonicum]|uniref:DUF2958 domain-containing protein n=1 Tax=Bradyrhizobium japonicum TaxID=375 RepID=UPI003B680A39